MKYFIIVSLLLLSVLYGCKHSAEPDNESFYVNFEAESSFQNNHVKATLDNKTLLDSTITTNYTISLAWGSGLQKISKKDHVLRFEVMDFGVQKNYTINPQYDTTTVIIQFDKESRDISFKQFDGLFLRD